jgi:hypothetical protein
MNEYGGNENGGRDHSGYLLFVWSPSGWTLRERDGEAPPPGAIVEDGEQQLRVSKLGPSPLPGDRRRCAYTLP